MNKVLIILSLLFVSNLHGKSLPINVYVISDNHSIDKNQFKDWSMKMGGLKIEYSKLDFFQSTFDTKFPDSWISGKTNVNYSPIKVDCAYDPCKSLKLFLNERSSDKTKLFYGGGDFPCNIQSFGIESSPLNMEINTILTKIQEECEINKTLKKNLTLVFYISSKESFASPVVSIESDTIKIKKGERLELTCTVKGNYQSILWEPSMGLSCTSCENPKLTVDKPMVYTVSATNQFGCSSAREEVVIQPLKVCEGKIQKCEILYSIDQNLYRTVLGDASKWLMASSQPGSKIYYLVCEPNCGERFEVSLYDMNNRKIMTEPFKLTDVAKGQKLHQDYPDYFIFKVNLNKYDFETKDFYRFEIKSMDDDGNNYPKYSSPATKFVDCGFVE
jgi:hypothetical protein